MATATRRRSIADCIRRAKSARALRIEHKFPPEIRPTDRQLEVYDYICRFIAQYGLAPTVREIGKHFKITSPNGVVCHLKPLQRLGLIERSYNLARGIRPVLRQFCPCCGQKIE